MTVDPKKLMKEWVRKKTATPMEPKTTAIHPAFNRGLLFACSSSLARNFQPWRLVAWQNRWKQPEDVDIVGTSLRLLPIMTYPHFHIWQNFGWAKTTKHWNKKRQFSLLLNTKWWLLCCLSHCAYIGTSHTMLKKEGIQMQIHTKASKQHFAFEVIYNICGRCILMYPPLALCWIQSAHNEFWDTFTSKSTTMEN